MLTIAYHPHFDKAYKKFTKGNRQRVRMIDKDLRLFAANQKHPSLNLEKLVNNDIWSIRLDRSNRLFFVWNDEGDTVIFFFVGHHDSYRSVIK